ncbi:MAG: sulfotransferase, partial [Gammaproteobacteria bacterium]|nr:sulfotransferase [Gammaproteobacteria bacterium]
MQLNTAPIIVLGCPRSGTQLTARILGGFPGNFLVTEHSLKDKQRSCPEDRSGVVDHAIWWRHFRFAEYDELTGRPAVDTPIYDAGAIQKVREEYLDLAGTQRLVIKNPVHLLRVKMLQEMFPDARFVFCIRHPWHTIQSMIIKGNTSFLLRTSEFST